MSEFSEKENQVTARVPQVRRLSTDIDQSVTTASLTQQSPVNCSTRSRESSLCGVFNPLRPLLTRPPNLFHIRDLTNV